MLFLCFLFSSPCFFFLHPCCPSLRPSLSSCLLSFSGVVIALDNARRAHIHAHIQLPPSLSPSLCSSVPIFLCPFPSLVFCLSWQTCMVERVVLSLSSPSSPLNTGEITHTHTHTHLYIYIYTHTEIYTQIGVYNHVCLRGHVNSKWMGRMIAAGRTSLFLFVFVCARRSARVLLVVLSSLRLW